jgi:hypothetical protein
MNIQFQRLRFERQFPEISLQFDENKNEYVDQTTQLIFKGWMKCAETITEDNVTIYFSRTYGWCLEKADGNGIDHPEFDEESEALEYAEKQGWIIVESSDPYL